MRRIFTAVPKYCGSRPGASARMSHGAASITLSRNQRKGPDETARQLEKKRGALCPLRGRKQRDESEDDAVDQHRIQSVQRAHRNGQGIGRAVRAQQVCDQRHPADAQHVAGEDAGNDGQATAHQWAFHGAGDDAFRVNGRRWFRGIQSRPQKVRPRILLARPPHSPFTPLRSPRFGPPPVRFRSSGNRLLP